MVKIFRSTLFVFLFTFISINAQSILVRATTDTSDYKVGDYITLTLEVRYDKSIKVELPPVKDSVKVLEYINKLPVDKKENEGKIIEYHKFIFSKYDSGKVTIPSLKFSYSENNSSEKNILLTTPFEITVHTLQVNTQEDIKDVKEPLTISLPWWLILLIILGIASVIVGGYYLYKFIKKKTQKHVEAVPEIKIPAHQVALQNLNELEAKQLWQNGKIKEYHSEITEIIRTYFEARFNFRALEMPSSEILPVLSYIEEGKKVVEMADKFFSNADLVKFAKFEPMPQVNDEMLKQAYDIVNNTIEVVKVEPEIKDGETNVQ